MATHLIHPESKTCDWTVQGIMNLSPEGLNELCGAVMEMNQDKEFVKGYNMILAKCIASQEDFDVEHNFKVIRTIYERYNILFDRVRQEYRTGGVEGLNDEDHTLVKAILEHGLPEGMLTQYFAEMITSYWYGRKRYIQWFHKKMAEDDMSAPVEIYNSEFGRGLRTTRDVKKGELLCYYPMDWVSDPSLAPKHEGGRDVAKEKWMCLQNAGVIGYGNPHDPEGAKKVMDQLVENKGRITANLNDYGFSFGSTDDGICHIWGDPDGQQHQKNNWFVGHMINDGAYHPDQTEEGYNELSKKIFAMDWNGENSNHPVNVRLNSRMTAIRDIKKGEPLLTIYGSEYWFDSGRGPEGELESRAENSPFCRHTINHMSTGQKKKAKKKRKEINLGQRQTFEQFRNRTAEKAVEENEIDECHPYQIVITDVSGQDGRCHVSSTIAVPEGWQPHHPTQFANFYPTQ